MSLLAVNMPKYATVLNGGVGVLGTGASTVEATVIGVDGAAADAKVVYTAGAYGGRVESLMASTDNSAAVTLIVYAVDVTGGGIVHPLGICTLPITSGAAATIANVDVINSLVGLPINAQFQKYIPLRPNMTLKVAVLAALAANKYVWAKTTGLDLVA